MAYQIICQHCEQAAPHRAHGLCGPCAVYRWRTGRDRPAYLATGAPRLCQTCGQPTAGQGARCGACRGYRTQTGRERPAALYARPRCAQCTHYLPLGAPTYQTLCRRCATAWLQQVNRQEARTVRGQRA